MTTTTAIHFDRASGRLLGTEMPAIPDLIEGMKAHGLKATKGKTWLPSWGDPFSPKCGCLLGIASAIKGDGDPRGEMAYFLTADAIARLSLPWEVGYAIAEAFDGKSTGYLGDDGEQAANYAHEAGMAIAAAGLWHRPA